jgi:hypothetical protein
MSYEDIKFFERRAEEERLRAATCRDHGTAEAQRYLAEKYAAVASAYRSLLRWS